MADVADGRASDGGTGRWREAIHFVYGIDIAVGVWSLVPADQTRTPREYLSLVPDGIGARRV